MSKEQHTHEHLKSNVGECHVNQPREISRVTLGAALAAHAGAQLEKSETWRKN